MEAHEVFRPSVFDTLHEGLWDRGSGAGPADPATARPMFWAALKI